MPLVTIRLARREPPTSTAQKSTLIAGVTRLLQDVLAKRADDVTVLIDELDPDNWGQGGLSATALRQARKAETAAAPAVPTGLAATSRRLPHSTFTDVDLSQSVFSDVNLRGAVFDNTALTGATLRNVDLGAASIADAQLEGLTIDGVLVTELFRVYRERAAR